MKLLLDENLSPLHVHTLRGLSHDAVSVIESGLSGADDSVVRAFAIASERILVTLDADFANVMRFPPAGTPGVVRLRLHPATESSINELLRSAFVRLQETDLRGKLAVIDSQRIRIRS